MMTEKAIPKDGKQAEQSREGRLKSALKANLAKRKAQMRARATQETGHTGSNRSGKDKD